jgi:hypothetical protein
MSIRPAHIARGHRTSSLSLGLLLPFALATAIGCNKTEPKPDPDTTTAPKPAQPIPSDFDMNDFFVGDAGAPGATGGNPADPSAAADQIDPSGGLAAAAPASTAPAAHPNLKLVDPGAEPKTKRRYDLKTGHADTLKFVLQTNLTEQQGAQKESMQQPPILMTMTVTPTAKSADGLYTFAVKLVKSDVGTSPNDPPQVAQLAKRMQPGLQALAGTTGSFTMDARGSLGQFTLGAGTNPAVAEAADKIAPLVQQALEGAVVEFPEEPIGKGARWQEVTDSNAEGVKAKVTIETMLADVNADGVSVVVKTVRSAPSQQVADPRAPKGTTVAIDGTALSTVTTHLDHLVKKAQGEAMTKATVTEMAPPAQPGAAPQKAGPQTSTQIISVKQSVEGS